MAARKDKTPDFRRTRKNGPEPGEPVSAHGSDVELADETVATTRVQVPGAAVETKADREAREALADEPVAEVPPVEERVTEYQGVQTQDPVANRESRSNIVEHQRY